MYQDDDEAVLGEKFYGVRYVADMFQVTTETVRDWIKAGRLPGHQINNRWKVKRSDLIKFANSKYGPQEGVSA